MCLSVVSCSSNSVDDEEAYINDEIGEDIYDDYDSNSNETDTEDVYEKNYSDAIDEVTNESSNKAENSQSNNANNGNQSEDSSSKAQTKTYGLNEKWVVPNRFEFKITAVERHYVCETFSRMDIPDPKDAAIVCFEVKNIGVSPKLNVNRSYSEDDMNFEIFDENGQKGDILIPTIYCDHDKGDTSIITGGKASSSYTAFLVSKSDKVTIVVNNGVDYYGEYHTATFVCNVTNSQSVEKPTDDTEKQSDESVQEDETNWTLDEVSEVHKLANNAHSDYKKAYDYILDAFKTKDSPSKLLKYKSAITNITSAKLDLEDALDIINKNESVTLTNSEYSTLKEHVESTIKMCENLEKIEFTEENCDSLHSSFSQDTFSMGSSCLGMISITLKMKEAFK